MGTFTLRPHASDWPLARVDPGQTVTIGRHPENTIALRHASISRRHAVLEVQDGALLVRDLRSLNGTFMNGERLSEPRLLQDRDVVQFGTIRYTVEAEVTPDDSLQRVVKHFVPGGETFMSDRMSFGLTALKRSDKETPTTDTARLATLLAIANALGGAENETELGDRVLDELAEIIVFDSAALLLHDEDGGMMPVVTRPQTSRSLVSRRVSMTIVQEALRRGEAVLTTDAGEDPRFHAARSIAELSVQSAMCLPLLAQGHPIGALYFDSRALAASYTEGDLAYLGAFAAQTALALSNMQLQRRIRDEAVVRANFSRFFSPNTVQAILERDAPLELGGEERIVTLLFADIRGYTQLTEQLAPAQLVELLNDYYPQMVAAVFAHDGTLEKFIGDALVAVWGAPLSHEDDAARTVQAAIDMQRAIVDLNAWWQREGRPYTITVGIGISTGPALAGNIGSEQYLQYATIGDVTNIASRLCDAAAGGEILATEATAAAAPDVAFGEVREIQVKGKDAPVPVCTVPYDVAPVQD